MGVSLSLETTINKWDLLINIRACYAALYRNAISQPVAVFWVGYRGISYYVIPKAIFYLLKGDYMYRRKAPISYLSPYAWPCRQ